MNQLRVCISKHSHLTDKLFCPVAASLMEGTDRAIAIDRNSNNACKVWDFDTKECMYSFGSYGTGTGQFKYPIALSIVGATLWVADYNRNVIIAFTPDGDLVTEVDLSCFAQESRFAKGPWSLCYSENSCSLYGTFTFSNEIFRLSSQLPFLTTFGKTILFHPLCICIGEKEISYVLDKTASITYFQENGYLLGNIQLIAVNSWCNESLVRFVIDNNGNFIICPSSLNTILVFTQNGQQIFPISNEQNTFAFDEPLGLSFDRKKSLLAVSDTYNSKIQFLNYSCFMDKC